MTDLEPGVELCRRIQRLPLPLLIGLCFLVIFVWMHYLVFYVFALLSIPSFGLYSRLSSWDGLGWVCNGAGRAGVSIPLPCMDIKGDDYRQEGEEGRLRSYESNRCLCLDTNIDSLDFGGGQSARNFFGGWRGKFSQAYIFVVLGIHKWALGLQGRVGVLVVY